MVSIEANGSDGREPVLRVPEDRTVLPNVDRAMPVLETIATAVSRKRGRFNVAVLKSLQESGTGRWKIKEIQDALDWLEPQSATDLISGLRISEVHTARAAQAAGIRSSDRWAPVRRRQSHGHRPGEPLRAALAQCGEKVEQETLQRELEIRIMAILT